MRSIAATLVLNLVRNHVPQSVDTTNEKSLLVFI
jgi:hypothetical protein